MEKYGTYVIFHNVGEPKTTVTVPYGDTQLIEELDKSAEWKREDEEDTDEEIQEV